jgi:hypothetical protein
MRRSCISAAATLTSQLGEAVTTHEVTDLHGRASFTHMYSPPLMSKISPVM